MCKQMVFQLTVAVVEAMISFSLFFCLLRLKTCIAHKYAPEPYNVAQNQKLFTVCISFLFLILIKRNCMEHISYAAVDGLGKDRDVFVEQCSTYFITTPTTITRRRRRRRWRTFCSPSHYLFMISFCNIVASVRWYGENHKKQQRKKKVHNLVRVYPIACALPT